MTILGFDQRLVSAHPYKDQDGESVWKADLMEADTCTKGLQMQLGMQFHYLR
jgi:hypothetical protein